MLLNNLESKKKILDTFKDMYDHVSVSLGPNGHTAIIRQENGNHIITKDGVTIVKHYKAADELSNMLVDIIKEMSQRTDISVGDGTTSTVVFAYHLFERLFNLINSGSNYVDLMRGVDDAIGRSLVALGKFKEEITTTNQINNIAYVSSNNDKEVADIIQRAIEDVGNDGVIITSRNRQYSKTTLAIRDGFSFDAGYVSPKLITNEQTKTVEYYDPHILVTDYPIRVISDIWPTLQLMAADKRPLIIIADEVTDEALGAIITNAISGTVSICAINAPYYGEERKAFFEDLCDLTGATMVSRYNGKSLKDVAIRDFGLCSKFNCSKNQTTIINGAGDMDKVKAKVESLRAELVEVDTIEEAEEINARINRLASGVAEIFIGGYTESEIKEKKYRFDDALNAVQASYKSGTVVGGGVTYINIAERLKEVPMDDMDDDYRRGYSAVIDALYAPFNRLVESANRKGEEKIILGGIQEGQDEYGLNYGYNMLTHEYCDLRAEGIIEPTLIPKNVIKNSSSIVKLLLNSAAVIL